MRSKAVLWHAAGWALAAVLMTACEASPAPAPAAAEPSQPGDLRLGAWQRIEPVPGTEKVAWTELLEITDDHWTWASPERIQRRGPIIANETETIEASLWGIRQSFATRLAADGTLEVSWGQPQWTPGSAPEQLEHRFRRLESPPAVLDVTPSSLGEPAGIEPLRLQALQTELASRRQRDQEVRQVFQSGSQPTPEQLAEMMAVDTDNTAWLKQIVVELSWIDVDRFGEEAANAAFLLVQHSGDLPLMLAALPLIERDVQSGILRGVNYALLYDRSRLSLGRHQRYGSQLVPGPDGMFVAPLEDPANVDARRAELGMEPLTDYLEHFRNDQRPGEIEIKEEF